MKKRLFFSLTFNLACLLCFYINIKSYADPKMMSNGELFDAAFYAEENPDVVKAYGKSEKELYRHYTEFGKNEGRRAYKTDDIKEKNNPRKCILIVGDSRTCSLINTMKEDLEYKKLYNSSSGCLYEAIFQNGDTYIAICGEGGGYYYNGALDRTVVSMDRLLNSRQEIKQADEYYYFNLFGVNDIHAAGSKAFDAPSDYMAADESIADGNTKIKKMYQFNAGPVVSSGWMTQQGIINNATIKKYNEKFKATNNVKVIDLYSYLAKRGYGAIIDSSNGTQMSGIHYDSDTNRKIISLIFSLVD